MSAGDNKVIFHRSKNTGDENLPDSWNDLSIVNAYDAAVSNKVNNRITYDDLVYENASNSKDTSVEAPSKAKKSRKRRKKNAAAKRKQSPWKAGDTCMALYSGDNRYYRAKIIKILQNKVCIRYEDYQDDDVTLSLNDVFPEHLWTNQNENEDRGSLEITFSNNNYDENHDNGQNQQRKRRRVYKQMYTYSSDENDDLTSQTSFIPPPHMDSDLNHLKHQVRDCSNLSKEALSSMLVSWYMAGYQTGYYRGLTTDNN